MDINDIINLYNQGKSLTFIANKYGTYGAKIKNILIENGVTIRTHAEQNRISNQERGKKVNHQYFDNIDTPQKAWMLGFLAADGTINTNRNSIKIGLSSTDRGILEQIKEEIEIERPILDYMSNQGFAISELTWSSENQKKQLAKYDIVPQKTYHAIHLPDLPINLQLIYFLGFFDGDGCFKNDGKYCRLEVISYRTEILQDFSDLMSVAFGFENQKVYKNPKRDIYSLTYSTEEAIRILEYVYQYMLDCNCFFLQRKYDKYCDWKKQNNWKNIK